MSERNPVIDPRPGDELSGDPWRYRVVWVNGPIVMYEIHAINMRPGWSPECATSSSHSVSLAGWRDMAVGLTVEKVA